MDGSVTSSPVLRLEIGAKLIASTVQAKEAGVPTRLELEDKTRRWLRSILVAECRHYQRCVGGFRIIRRGSRTMEA